MKFVCLFVVLVSSLTACGKDDTANNSNEPLDIQNFSTEITDDFVWKAIAYISVAAGESKVAATKEASLLGLTLEITDDEEQAKKDCGREVYGCFTVTANKIEVAVMQKDAPNANAWDQKAWFASVLAHELGHAYYYQTTGDADPAHRHDEWFLMGDGISVVSRTYFHFD